ncbi:MAG: carbohydrate kinase family protein [Clostridia bacterium]|nr:carbohydrate kinase family protein [Clostridia bacterium]
MPKLSERRALLGFDGFEDRVIRLNGIGSMAEMGRYLLNRQGMSGVLTYGERGCKMGGNMPIMANALGKLGVVCECVGMLGEPETAGVFADMSPGCALHSVGKPGQCMALEFETGKLMLSDNASVEALRFADIVARIGMKRLIEMHECADLICYLNWSETPGLTEIERHCLRDIVPYLSEKPRVMLFDLADVTPRKAEELREELALLREFSGRMRTVLSMNENEARAVLKLVADKDPGEFDSLTDDDVRGHSERILESTGVHMVAFRGNRRVFAAERGAFCALNTLYVEKPALMTGAGDNFDAGIATALLLGGNLEQMLTLGTTACSHYIERGKSATPVSMLHYCGDRGHCYAVEGV